MGQIGANVELDLAMEALAEYELASSLKTSDELLCECFPTSYKQVAEYLGTYSHKNESVEDILSRLNVSQGCGTCRKKATQFVELIRRGEASDERI